MTSEAFPRPNKNGINVTYVYAGIATLITIVLAVGLYARKKRKKYL